MDTKELLLKFSGITGVAGAESEAAEYAAGLLSSFGDTRISALGSVICEVKKPGPNKPHIMLDAHIDEIGMIVTFIDDKGFLCVGACGGVDRRLLLASQVLIHAEKGDVNGVICSIPPHLAKDGEKNKTVDEIFIDIGADSKGEAEKFVSQGDRVTIKSSPRELLNGLVSGKAIDDRAGCVSILKALEILKSDMPDCGLTVVFSSMEETGGAGAKTAAFEIDPTHAAVIDVSFAYTPDSEKKACGELNKGPMIGFAPILDSELSNTMRTICEKNNIPYQNEVMGGKTGTNADHIASSRSGVKTALVSIPQKYMHTPIETVSACDVENTAGLIAAFVSAMAERGL